MLKRLTFHTYLILSRQKYKNLYRSTLKFRKGLVEKMVDKFEAYMAEFFLINKGARFWMPGSTVCLIVAIFISIACSYLALLSYNSDPYTLNDSLLEFFSLNTPGMITTIIAMFIFSFFLRVIFRSLKQMRDLPEYILGEAGDLLENLSLEKGKGPEGLLERLEILIFSQTLKSLLKKSKEVGGIKLLKEWLIKYKKLKESDSRINSIEEEENEITTELKTEKEERDSLKRSLVP